MSVAARLDVPQLGTRVYGVAAMAFGAIALVWGDFATVWHPVPAGVPYRAALAYVSAVLLLAGGAAVQYRRALRPALLLLATLYFLAACLWIRRVVGYPQLIGTWSGFAEEFSLTAAALTVYAMNIPVESAWAPRMVRACRVLFGLCVISFGLAHLLALAETASMVPAWLPLGQRFWAGATGTALVLAGVSILTGIQALLAARLLTVLLGLFGLLVWIPTVVGHPHDHIAWAGNAINLAVTGAAWMMADSLREESSSTRTVTWMIVQSHEQAPLLIVFSGLSGVTKSSIARLLSSSICATAGRGARDGRSRTRGSNLERGASAHL